MRIAVCITRFEPGGQSVVIEEQTKRLTRMYDYEFVLFTEKLVKPCPHWMECIEVKPWILKFLPLINSKATKMLDNFDIIHCHDSIPFMDLALKARKPTLVTSHGFPPPNVVISYRRKLHMLLSRYMYPRYYSKVTKVIAISKYIKRWLIKELRVPESKVCLIYNGIDLSLFKPLPRNAWLEYRFGDPMILYVGYIGRVKRTEILLYAMKEIIDEYPQAKLVLVGHGSREYKMFLLGLAKKLGLEQHIRVVGYVAKAKLPLIYNAADVLVITSRWEGFGLPIVEALSCGTPVVARDCCAMKEHIIESQAGMLYSKDIQLSEAILKILDNGKEKYAPRAVTYAQRFSWDENIRLLNTIYRDILCRDE